MRYGSPLIRRSPRWFRYYRPYTSDSTYFSEPVESALKSGLVYRGEGRGSTLYQPGEDDTDVDGTGVTQPGVAHPRVARVLEENAVGEASSWLNARTGAETTVMPTRDLEGDEDCREFSHTVNIPSGQIESSGVACRTEEGAWEIVL